MAAKLGHLDASKQVWVELWALKPPEDSASSHPQKAPEIRVQKPGLPALASAVDVSQQSITELGHLQSMKGFFFNPGKLGVGGSQQDKGTRAQSRQAGAKDLVHNLTFKD